MQKAVLKIIFFFETSEFSGKIILSQIYNHIDAFSDLIIDLKNLREKKLMKKRLFYLLNSMLTFN